MSGQPFTPDWLAVREPFDARARSRFLARHFAAALPPHPRLLDLGAGSGSLFRWLAPIIRGPQDWVWLDYDPALLRHGLRRTARWAQRLGYAVHWPQPDMLEIATAAGPWRVTIRPGTLEQIQALPLADVHGVTCSALLDLFTRDWLERLLLALQSRPFYAAMNVTAHDGILPHSPHDATLWHGYVRNQMGQDGSAALGPRAASTAQALSRAFGRACLVARSDWIVHPRDRAMLHHMLGFVANAARAATPSARHIVDRWERQRRAQLQARRLAMRIGHLDLLIRDGISATPPA